MNLSRQVYYPLRELINYVASKEDKGIFIYRGLPKVIMSALEESTKLKELSVPDLQTILQNIKNLFSPDKDVRKKALKIIQKTSVVHLYAVFRMLSSLPVVSKLFIILNLFKLFNINN